jgi:hypothetical protein
LIWVDAVFVGFEHGLLTLWNMGII